MTALYSSVFFAATIADARAKDKRRAEWEEKIAAVNKQVSDLKDEEQRLLESLSRRKRPIKDYTGPRVSPGLVPIRHYSTTPKLAAYQGRPVPKESSSESIILQGTRNRGLQTSSAAVEEECPPQTGNPSESSSLREPHRQNREDYVQAVEHELDRDTYFADELPIPSWAKKDRLRLQAIQKLALRQLAIRLLLRPCVAHSYEGIQMNYSADFRLPRLHVQDLFKELNSIRKRIYRLKEDRTANFDDLVQDLPSSQAHIARQKCRDLDVELKQDIEQCCQDQMPLEELLLRLANNLVQSPDPDRPKAFRLMITAFSRLRQNDVVHLILKAILPNFFYISISLIISTLNFFRRAKDLKNFDLFLQMLRGEGYPLNMRHSPPYKLVEVNGLKVTIPPYLSDNVVIYSTLINAALRFDQPERADAWLCVARRSGFMDNFDTLYSYLKFCKLRNDWETGVNVLRRALAYLPSSSDVSVTLSQRLIVLMVQLCDNCDKTHVSEALINAYVMSGFDRGAAKKQLDCSFPSDPTYKRWMNAPERPQTRNLPAAEKCSVFVSMVGPQVDELFRSEGKDAAKKRQYIAGQYSESILSWRLHDTPVGHSTESYYIRKPAVQEETQKHSKQIKALQDEIAELKKVVAQLKKSNP